MKETDLIQMDRNRNNTRFVEMENQLKAKDEHIRFIQTELEKVNSEFEAMVEERVKIVLMENEELKQKLLNETKRADKAEGENEDLKKRIETLESIEKVAKAAEKLNFDHRAVIHLIQKHIYGRSSESTRFLNDVIDPDNPSMNDADLSDIAKVYLADRENSIPSRNDGKALDYNKSRIHAKANSGRKLPIKGFSSRKRVYTATEIKQVCLTEIPAGTRIVRRKNTESGLDTWQVEIFTYEPAKVVKHIYDVARVTAPGEGLFNVGQPERIVKGNPIHPSFARFYFDSKFGLNLSENSILQLLKSMKTTMPQSSLNLWMHQIMSTLRESLENLMLEAIKKSDVTYNDETRILVRSRESKEMKFKYKIEYIHACLSMKEKLIAMIYKEGSRGHEVQEEAIFKRSEIKIFMADRAPMYEKIVKDFEEYQLVRAACWVHLRRRLVDAYSSDPRVRELICLINILFKIERDSKELKHTPQQRLRFRLRHSLDYVNKIIRMAKEMRMAGEEYGELVHRALNYLLDDEEAFKVFLKYGEIEISNNVIEYMFRHIAMGRRTWLHSGSHFAAQNIAFMYSLVESCRLNDINFGVYIEDILTRIMKGEKADNSFLPNKWVARTPETGIQTA